MEVTVGIKDEALALIEELAELDRGRGELYEMILALQSGGGAS